MYRILISTYVTVAFKVLPFVQSSEKTDSRVGPLPQLQLLDLVSSPMLHYQRAGTTVTDGNERPIRGRAAVALKNQSANQSWS